MINAWYTHERCTVCRRCGRIFVGCFYINLEFCKIFVVGIQFSVEKVFVQFSRRFFFPPRLHHVLCMLRSSWLFMNNLSCHRSSIRWHRQALYIFKSFNCILHHVWWSDSMSYWQIRKWWINYVNPCLRNLQFSSILD